MISYEINCISFDDHCFLANYNTRRAQKADLKMAGLLANWILMNHVD